MTFLEAAYEILREAGEPIHFREITERALQRGLVHTDGKTPAASLNAVITLDIKRAKDAGEQSRFVRAGRGMIGLREWKHSGRQSTSTVTRTEPSQEIPNYEALMLPLMRLASDGEEHSMREGIDVLAEQFRLSDQQLRELLPSGRQTTFENRVGWAKTYLKKAGLLDAPRRGAFRITPRGRQALLQHPTRIDRDDLMQYPEFVAFQSPRASSGSPSFEEQPSERTPEEDIEAAYQQVQEQLAQELLQTVKSCSATFFERLVVDLLVRMGYGGTRRDAGQAIGGSGDGGIDGIIKEDRLGLDILYVQAKRWDGTVGRPQIQQFVGALQGQRARKGVFITTSDFSQTAREYVSHLDTKIVLIDGATLAQLMMDHDIGVNTVATYCLKRMDSDYFIEE
ncbi:MAG: restriction endonuclease [Anaerolineae bacterium]|nr:restriction endonuclease [Anaerolineae bacterium]